MFQRYFFAVYNYLAMKIGVIGAGVSGIFFSISRKMSHPEDEIIVFEHLDKPLKKILATGNGKCNIANAVNIIDQYNNPLVKLILKEYDFPTQKEFLNSLNIKIKVVNNLAYPISESAVTVRNALLTAVEKHHVQIELETAILDYEIKGPKVILKTNQKNYELDKLVFATGGKSSPNLGSDGSIIPLLEAHHYHLKEFRPALCPIHTKNITKDLDGVRVKSIVQVLDNEKLIFEEAGEVLFKDKGLSGIVIFNASRVMKEDKPYKIKINLLPDISKEELEQFLKKNGQEALLNAYLHPRLAKSILKSQVPDHQIIDWLKGVIYTFDKPYGFDNSQVSIGGIEFSDIDENLGSKIERGIHFLGELLDYDAPCGGYNLMWAIGTGLYLAKKL